jgi:hypothetical protein
VRSLRRRSDDGSGNEGAVMKMISKSVRSTATCFCKSRPLPRPSPIGALLRSAKKRH